MKNNLWIWKMVIVGILFFTFMIAICAFNNKPKTYGPYDGKELLNDTYTYMLEVMKDKQ